MNNISELQPGFSCRYT